jgi:DNA modification methylase
MDQHKAGDVPELHIANFVRNVLPGAKEEIIAHNSKNIRSFRIVVSRENRPAGTNEKLRVEAERRIARISGLAADRGRPGTEFWFLYRSEGFSLFMKRLTLRPSWEKSLHPGELPPPLAWTLCRLARLRHNDMVLDPFCGYGSIPIAAISHFHITNCIACEIHKKTAVYAAAKCKNRAGASFVLHHADFRSLVSLLPGKSVDAIITDPPWGHYEAKSETLYDEMFGVFGALLKEGGRLVILGPGNDEIPNAVKGRFTPHKAIPILLSGRKAAIFQFTAS